MPLTLDHLFVFGVVGAPFAKRLVAEGFHEGSSNDHPGQGTANRRFFFDGSMLELIWVRNDEEARSAVVAPTRLWERAHYRDTGDCPFGICLRGGDDALPFDTFEYRPPYLPAELSIPIARTRPDEPLVFTLPIGTRRAPAAPPRVEPREHANGARTLTELRITLARRDADALSPALRTVESLGIATFTRGERPLMELSFDGRARARSLDLRPDVPLVLRW